MGRFRKVDTRMWSDAKFRKLSRDAKLIWLYLLTGPETTSLPGIINIGEAGLAEALGMDLETFRKAFSELSPEGGPSMVKADWEARLVWVVNALKYNLPASPNVVKGWATHWDNAPECDLKQEAFRALRKLLGNLSESFLKSFDEAIANPLPNQEQEQEQEQEKDLRGGLGGMTPPPAAARKVRPKRPETFIPDSWSPTSSHISKASDLGLDVKAEAERFRNHAEANDRKLRNWDAGFSMWLSKSREFAVKRGDVPAHVSPPELMMPETPAEFPAFLQGEWLLPDA